MTQEKKLFQAGLRWQKQWKFVSHCCVWLLWLQGLFSALTSFQYTNIEWRCCCWIILSDLSFLSGGTSDDLSAETRQAGCRNNVDCLSRTTLSETRTKVKRFMTHMMVICTMLNIMKWNLPTDTTMQQDVTWVTAAGSGLTWALSTGAPELQKCIHTLNKSLSSS